MILSLNPAKSKCARQRTIRYLVDNSFMLPKQSSL